MPWQRSFQLKEFNDFWRISPISFRDGSYGAMELKKELLEQGSKKTQTEWLAYSIDAVRHNGFYVGSAPLHYSLTDLLCENKNHLQYTKIIEEIRNFLEERLKLQLNTLSIPFYHPMPSPDEISHFQGFPKSYLTREHLFGTEEYLPQLWDADRMCLALLGEEDSARVNAVNQWLCNKDTYLSRVRTKIPSKGLGKIQLGIDANSFRIEVGTSSTITQLPALGMRIRRLRKRGNA